MSMDKFLLTLALLGLVAAGHYVQHKAAEPESIVCELNDE